MFLKVFFGLLFLVLISLLTAFCTYFVISVVINHGVAKQTKPISWWEAIKISL